MNQDSDEQARELFFHVASEIPDAALKYERTAAFHRFVITRMELTYVLSFPTWVLAATALADLTETLSPAINRILSGAAPRRIWVGAVAGEGDGVRAEPVVEEGWQGY